MNQAVERIINHKEGTIMAASAIAIAGALFAAASIAQPAPRSKEVSPTPTPTSIPETPSKLGAFKAIEEYSKRPRSEVLIDWLKNLQNGISVTRLDCSKQLNFYNDMGFGGLIATTDPNRGNYERDIPALEGNIIGGLPRNSVVTIRRIVMKSSFGSKEIWTEDAQTIDEAISEGIKQTNSRPTFSFAEAPNKTGGVIYMNIIRGDVSDCESVN